MTSPIKSREGVEKKDDYFKEKAGNNSIRVVIIEVRQMFSLIRCGRRRIRVPTLSRKGSTCLLRTLPNLCASKLI